MKCNLQPIGSRVLIRLEQPITRTPGGVILPDIAKEKPRQGKIEALGTDIKTDSLAVGDIVLFPKFAFEALPDNDELGFVPEESLLAKVVK